MNLFNLLTTSQEAIQIGVAKIETIEFGWLVRLIKWLFDLFAGNYAGVAIGAICFTLILKTVVLPLDIFSRVKTKKQALIMESMRPEMEKLQKQYANDKAMYNQKYLELQKKNGYSPFGACIPMLVSLVIFWVVFSSFSTYSNYANLTTYNDLVTAYNQSVVIYVSEDENDADNSHFLISGESVNVEGYFIDYEKFEAFYAASEGGSAFSEDMKESEKNAFVVEYIQRNAREAAAEHYRANKDYTSFGWIGNVWYPDSMLNKEVPSFSDFSSAIARAVGTGLSSTYEESYNEVTYNLTTEKETYNGYFVLIVLSIGMMFLQQFVMMRSQKATNEFSSVDGSAARTNKMMMIFLPIVFGFFAFLYSAAFSLYMITNTLYSFISTIIINKVVSVRFAKMTAEDLKRRSTRKRLK